IPSTVGNLTSKTITSNRAVRPMVTALAPSASSVTSNPAEPKCSRTSARTRTSSVTTSARRFAAVALDANRAAVMFILMGGSYRSSTSSLFHIEHHPFTLGSGLGDKAPRWEQKALRAVPGDIRRGRRSCRKREGEHVAVRVEHAESEQATRVAVQPRCLVAVLAHLLDCANSQESLSSRGHAALTRQDTSCISILVGRGHQLSQNSGTGCQPRRIRRRRTAIGDSIRICALPSWKTTIFRSPTEEIE